MCGIAGYLTSTFIDSRHKVALAILAKNMEARGGHSWGTMTARGADVRGLGSIDAGLRIPAKLPTAFALHTRYGTQGARTLENAHPFTIAGALGTVVGIHNGIISNHGILNQRHARACAVDSQHIFHHIANGIPFDDLEGYGTIVYTFKGEWFIGRFNDGEIAVAETDAGIFYASTKAAVLEAISYSNLTFVKWLKVRNNTVYRLTIKGLRKAYTVTVGSTTRRWNDRDDVLDWYVRRDDTLGDVDGNRADDEPLMQECDLCMDYVDDLWECGKGQFACASCYFETTGAIPYGYNERMESAYARRRTSA